ncbi:two-component response regulator ARR2 [Haematococcus lacustris]|uniref:Two-component response regulator ARR2 n=1 Tax=Haematococcus lacustris TaxID=44745 RepID=A0A699YPU4_HAELA|nr:two-component response regulator ARR2 [Haematococcus lacustris]
MCDTVCCKQFGAGRVVLEEVFRTSRVSSAYSSPSEALPGQPPKAFRWLRPVYSKAKRSQVRGLMSSTSHNIRFYDRDVSAALNIRRCADPDDDEDGGGSARALKRPRLVWTSQLHRRFEEAINKLGDQRAVPKNIMQEMKVEGLTRENVASHLQKWRLQNRRDEPRSGGAAAHDAGPTGADS